MSIEIAIRSGARQGERIELDLDTFRVGDTSDADVFFNPVEDARGSGPLGHDSPRRDRLEHPKHEQRKDVAQPGAGRRKGGAPLG